jgi:hypothetical protein
VTRHDPYHRTRTPAIADIFVSLIAAPDYGALVPLHIRDYLVGASPSTGNPPHDDDGDDGGDGDAEVGADDEKTGGRGRKACSHCGKVFYGKAPIVRAYPRTLRTARYAGAHSTHLAPPH